MPSKREGLLAEIEAGVLDDDDEVRLASLLQKCIVLGGQASSEKMRDWARRELNGYDNDDDLPDYRRIPAALTARLTNNLGYNAMTQRLYASDIPEAIRGKFRWEVATLGFGIGELEAIAAMGKQEHQLSPYWAETLMSMMNELNAAPNTRVDSIYWSVSGAAIEGLLVRVRTALAELVGELTSMTPLGQAVPDKVAADQAIQLLVTGNRNTITVSPQHAGDGSTNSVDVAAPADDAALVQGWKRWRKPGVLIVGISTVLAAVVGVFTWLDWTPW